MPLINHYNNDDILVRNIIAGLLNLLNEQISYVQTWSNEERENVDIAWFYNLGSSDERFMQDYYTFFGSECNMPKKIDGNFDYIPRGVLTLNSVDIVNSNTANRFVKGVYNKEINGKLETFSSYLYSIPLSLKLGCELWVDTMTTSLKIQQAIIETFFKTQTFYYYFRGLRLGAQVGFSDSINIDKTISYSFDSERRIKLTFDLEVESYQPVFDKTVEYPINDTIKSFGLRLYDSVMDKNDGIINITSPQENLIIPKGIPLMIEWNYKDENAIIQKVNISYSEQEPGKINNNYTIIEEGVVNHMFYVWNIPENFTDFKDPDIIYYDTSTAIIYRQPIIKIVPDIQSKLITEESFRIIDSGFFITKSSEEQMPISLEFTLKDKRIISTPENSILLNIKNGEVDKDNPVVIKQEIKYPEKINYKRINLRVSNLINKEVFSNVNNITVI